MNWHSKMHDQMYDWAPPKIDRFVQSLCLVLIHCRWVTTLFSQQSASTELLHTVQWRPNDQSKRRDDGVPMSLRHKKHTSDVLVRLSKKLDFLSIYLFPVKVGPK